MSAVKLAVVQLERERDELAQAVAVGGGGAHEVDDLRRELSLREAELSDVVSDRDALKSALEEAKSAAGGLRDAVEGASRRGEEQHEELRRARKECETLSLQLEGSRARADGMKDECARLVGQVDKLTMELGGARGARGEAERAREDATDAKEKEHKANQQVNAASLHELTQALPVAVVVKLSATAQLGFNRPSANGSVLGVQNPSAITRAPMALHMALRDITPALRKVLALARSLAPQVMSSDQGPHCFAFWCGPARSHHRL